MHRHHPTQLALIPPPDANLRHRDRKQIWYRDHEGQPSVQIGRYRVETIARPEAIPFLARHHYLGAEVPGAFFAHQYRDLETGEIVGMATYGPGGAVAIRPYAFPGLFEWVEKPNKRGRVQKTPVERRRGSCATLDRFCLLDSVPANAETHILKLSFARAREEHGLLGVVSFSDPVARMTGSGEVIFPGHIGKIYKGKGLIYTGKSDEHDMWMFFDDGSVLPDRSLRKFRNEEGQDPHVYAKLLRHGAEPMPPFTSRAEWLDDQLPEIARFFHHTGCHRYIAALDNTAEINPRLVRQPYPVALAA